MDTPLNPNVDPSELYEGPQPPGNVARLVVPVVDRSIDAAAAARMDALMAAQIPARPAGVVVPNPDAARPPRDRHDYVALLSATVDVLNARLLALLATIAACAMWGFCVYQPDTPRTLAALAFSLSVLLPLVALHWRRG